MRSSESVVELLPPGGSTFTEKEIEEFQKAYRIFDIQGDGRVSTDEIFASLSAMQHSVSSERAAKIRSAVKAVAPDHEETGLDFPQFIQFMKIMHEHNMAEATEQEQTINHLKYQERALIKYFELFPVSIRLRKGTPFLLDAINWLALVFGLVYALGTSLLVVLDENVLDQNPDGDAHYYDNVLYVLRLANLANILHLLLLLVDERKVTACKDAVKSRGYHRTNANFIRYIVRGTLVFTAFSNLVFLAGIRGLDWTSTDDISDAWDVIVLPAAQIFCAFWTLSYFAYFKTFVVPASACEYFKIFLADLFLLNWIRAFVMLFKQIIVLLLLVPSFFLADFICLAKLCCRSYLHTTGDDGQAGRRFQGFYNVFASVCG